MKECASVPPRPPSLLGECTFPQMRKPWWKSCAPAKNRQTLLRTSPFARRGRPPLHSRRSYWCLRGLCTLARKELRPEFRKYLWQEMVSVTLHNQKLKSIIWNEFKTVDLDWNSRQAIDLAPKYMQRACFTSSKQQNQIRRWSLDQTSHLLLIYGDPVCCGKPLVIFDVVHAVLQVAKSLCQVYLQQVPQQILQVRAEVGGESYLRERWEKWGKQGNVGAPESGNLFSFITPCQTQSFHRFGLADQQKKEGNQQPFHR